MMSTSRCYHSWEHLGDRPHKAAGKQRVCRYCKRREVFDGKQWLRARSDTK